MPVFTGVAYIIYQIVTKKMDVQGNRVVRLILSRRIF